MPQPTVLIVAENSVLAALIGCLAELAGYRPLFAAGGVSVAEAIARLHPRVTLLDVDVVRSAASAIFERAGEARSRVVLFTGARGRAEAEALAAIHGAELLELPVSPQGLSAILAGVLSAFVLLVGD
ncbi:MAG: hypothetical protein M3068_01180 [Gemmatimonadota bacterium]|nr:hypothetical protein [Gemmatimonadota bacterium]